MSVFLLLHTLLYGK